MHAPDAETKRRYLTLLPPSQVIDLCLAFEAHAPFHIRNQLWPQDIPAAIRALQQPQQPEPIPPRASHPPPQPQPPPYPHTPYYPPAAYYPPYPIPHPPQAQPQPPPDTSTEDLPSYEEMIVEALSECTDPEGLVPKNIFAKMQARYPLHNNFRPSASQALQKAYKRGRLLKNEDEGDKRYRLNPNWGGGNTSKRTTRRPQTQAQTLHASPPPRQSPFAQQSSQAVPEETTSDEAWQAAQNILKAINLQELLNTSTSPSHEDELPRPADMPESDAIQIRIELQAHLALLSSQLLDICREEEEMVPVPVT